MNNLSLKKNLSYEQLAIVQSELEKRKKSSVVMYLLWLFTGGIGGHRYYLGDIGIGIAMTLTLGGLGFWALLDVFFIGRRLAKKTEILETEIIQKVKEHNVNENNTYTEQITNDKIAIEPVQTPIFDTTNSNKANTINFHVTGVTFKNDSNKEIQPLLRRIAREIASEQGIEKYDGWTNKEIIEYQTEVAEFEGVEFGDYITFEKNPNNEFDKNAIKVIVNLNGEKFHIGHIPKKDNIEIGKLLDADLIDTEITDAVFVGGKIKEVEYDTEIDKEIIVVKELNLGVRITLYIKG